jgi:hypothetical protein
MSFEIKSKVVALETGRGVQGLTVEAYDADLLYDDKLGVGQTDAEGGCRIPVHVGFFFIAHAGTSVNESCSGKNIYQFSYRWLKLRTIIPDRFCIDELVQIADGMDLGQLMYATDWLKPYDPCQRPAVYRYGMFGHFLLMEEDWHQLRLRLGFDLDNV